MAVEASISIDNSVLTIGIKGKFYFSMISKFRKAYSNDSIKPERVIIDMRNTSAIDSSALGMLLNMQRYLKKEDGEISIVNCNQDVNKVFQITHLNKKFRIE